MKNALLAVVVCGIFCLSTFGMGREPFQSNCKQTINTVLDSAMSSEPIVVSMKKLEEHPDEYYGKAVTVDGELHRTFSDNVFTIEDNGLMHDKDILVISTVPKDQTVVTLEDSLDRGKNVRITGVVQPYDRGKLECAYGPLQLESREGHSFTQNPVLIVDRNRPAKAEIPTAQLEKPAAPVITPAPVEAAPSPAPSPEPVKPVEEPKKLPKTAGDLPLLAFMGLMALCGSLFLKRIA